MKQQPALGVITHESSAERRTDFLYRVSLKCFIRNKYGRILVVKERAGMDYWDLPGGGMDHGEDIKTTLARELHEEVSLESDFSYKLITVDEPVHLHSHNFWQLRLIFAITPLELLVAPGNDANAIAFMNPLDFKDSPVACERDIYRYALLTGAVS